MPSRRFKTIVADPPWAYEQFIPSHTPSQNRSWRIPSPYKSMTVETIAALPVGDWVDERGARLFLWTTGRYLGSGFDVLASWGFEFKQPLVWHKTGQPTPLPASVAPNHAEFLLVGQCGVVERIGTWPTSVIAAPRRAHSEKPEVFLDLIEQVSPPPRLELFARRARFGWDYWGDESLQTVELDAA